MRQKHLQEAHQTVETWRSELKQVQQRKNAGDVRRSYFCPVDSVFTSSLRSSRWTARDACSRPARSQTLAGLLVQLARNSLESSEVRPRSMLYEFILYELSILAVSLFTRLYPYPHLGRRNLHCSTAYPSGPIRSVRCTFVTVLALLPSPSYHSSESESVRCALLHEARTLRPLQMVTLPAAVRATFGGRRSSLAKGFVTRIQYSKCKNFTLRPLRFRLLSRQLPQRS